jgi:hypothetical protein
MSQAITIGGRAALSGIRVNRTSVTPFARTEYLVWANTTPGAMQHHDEKAVMRVCEYHQIPYVTDINIAGSNTEPGYSVSNGDTITVNVKYSEPVKATIGPGVNDVPSIALLLDSTANVSSANLLVAHGNTSKEWLTFQYTVGPGEELAKANGLSFVGHTIANNGQTFVGPTGLTVGPDFANLTNYTISEIFIK